MTIHYPSYVLPSPFKSSQSAKLSDSVHSFKPQYKLSPLPWSQTLRTGQRNLDNLLFKPISQPEVNITTDMFGRPLKRHVDALAKAGVQTAKPFTWISWPVIELPESLPDSRNFDWSAHCEVFKNSQSLCVYVAICDGLCTLAKASKLTLAKIGISRRLDTDLRMQEINTDQYGSISCIDGHWQQDKGFNNWEPVRLPTSIEPAYPSPVELLPRSLLVSLPNSLSVEEFDAKLKIALSTCILPNWISTPDGEIHCARQNVDRSTFKRYTPHYHADGSIKLKASEEIYIFRKKEHTDLLVQAIEAIIIQHLVSRP